MAWSIFTDGGGDAVAVAWAKQFLQQIGAPVTPGNVEFVYQWEKSEGGGGKYNPLNQGPVPGQPQLTTTGQQYGGGAADFASWQAGLAGADAFLHMPYYTQVLASLKADNPAGARTALWQSPWASSHYGYGTNWSNSPLPGNSSTITPLDLSGTTNTGGASGGTDTTTAAAIQTSDPACLIGLFYSGAPAASAPSWARLLPPVFRQGMPASSGFGLCFISKTNARAFIGGILIAGSALVLLTATATILKHGTKATDAADRVARVPGVRVL